MKKRIFLYSLVFLIVFVPVLVLAGEFQKAEEMFYKCNYSEALINYEKAMDKHSNNKAVCSYIQYQIAECSFLSRNWDYAEVKLNEYIKNNPESIYIKNAKERLVSLLFFQGRDNEALKKNTDLEKSEDNQISSRAYLRTAEYYLRKGKWLKSDEMLKKYAEIYKTQKIYLNSPK